MNQHFTLEFREVHTALHCVYRDGRLVAGFLTAADAAEYIKDHG